MSTLNKEQKQAVEYVDGPLLIVAGAGCGKTLVIINKIIHLITQCNYTPDSILAITFTNKAAHEMNQRIKPQLQSHTAHPTISTFHSFCLTVLRQHFHRLSGFHEFTIIDPPDRVKLVKSLASTFDINELTYPYQKVLYYIDHFKQQLLSPAAVLQNPKKYFVIEKIALIYEAYQKHLWSRQLIDFGDMLYFVCQIFEKFDDVLSSYQDQFRYVLVDEYQDTNYVQYRLIHYLVKNHWNLSVVGDFDQNIYSWRGASIKNILDFDQDFPKSHSIYLEQNYRSKNTILQAANKLISNNKNRKEKTLRSSLGQGDQITFYKAANEHDEYTFVANEIQKLVKKGQPIHDICILFRINSLSRLLEEKLTANQINYTLVGGLSFFERKEIKDILHYLRFILNPADITSFSRICNFPPRDLGPTTQKKMIDIHDAHQHSILDILSYSADSFSTRATRSISHFSELIYSLQKYYQQLKTDRISQLILKIIQDSGYEAYLKNQSTDHHEKLDNIYELINFARQEEYSLQDFIHKISLQTGLDQSSDSQDSVTLMNIHHAKGLEFDTVFLVGFEEEIIPHYRSIGLEDDLEEERRLCYVAITRAKSLLYLSSSAQRSLFGSLKAMPSSRFLAEFPQHLIDHQESSLLNRQKTTRLDKEFLNTTIDHYQTGESVSHLVWGTGRILKVDGQGADALLHIQFSGETKTLLAKYAPLTKDT